MALVHQVASSFSLEKSAGRAAFSSAVWDNIVGSAGVVGGAGLTNDTRETGGDEIPGSGVKGVVSSGFLSQQG